MKKFTLVSTVFNEKSRIHRTISDLEAQTCLPDEIIITDAGSTDGTFETLLEWKRNSNIPIKVLQSKGCNVAAGRNMAIRQASYNIVVSTDFGCRFHPHWLHSLLEPFEDPAVQVSGGAFSVLEEEIQTLAARAAYVLSAGYRIDVHEPHFIPSSRSIAYYRHVFDVVGGYCEWLTLAADDLVFGKELHARNMRIFMVDKPYVYWGRHLSGQSYIKEATRYGRGDGEAHVNFRNLLSNVVQLAMRSCMVLLTVAFLISCFITKQPFYFLLIPLVLMMPGLKAYWQYYKNWLAVRSKKYDGNVFLYGMYLLETTRIGYIRGYLNGYFRSNPWQKAEAKKLQLRLQPE